MLSEIIRLEQSTESLAAAIPRGILEVILSSVPQSSAVRASNDIMSGYNDVRQAMISKLKAQIDAVFDAIDKANARLWPALIGSDIDLTVLSEAYLYGSMEEIIIMLRYNYDAWRETPEPIDRIKAKYDGGICSGMSATFECEDDGESAEIDGCLCLFTMLSKMYSLLFLGNSSIVLAGS